MCWLQTKIAMLQEKTMRLRKMREKKNNENVRVTEESANNHIHDVTDMSHIISLKMEKKISTY